MSRQISLEEVKKHATEKSSWIVIHHDIYDVTSYLNEHPGGAEALLEFAGKDGTQAFEDVAHSEDARQIMKKYKIGTLPERERESPKCYTLTWMLIALAGAIAIGFAVKKFKT